MNDQTVMNNLLSVTKGACDLMMHGAIESGTPDVHSTFTQAFNDTLCMQNEIYAKMCEKGWYTPTPAEANKIQMARQKFAQG